MRESQIEDFLEQYPDIIEPELKVIKRQKKVGTGLIDLFCQDKNGNYVIIELKLEASHSSVAQIAKYIVSLESQGIPRQRLRGILVTRYIDPETEQLCNYFHIEAKGLALGEPRTQPTTANTHENLQISSQSTIINTESSQTLFKETLTRTEARIVKIILDANNSNKVITYSQLSECLNLTYGCLRGYISSIITKEVPLIKRKTRSGEVLFSIKKNN